MEIAILGGGSWGTALGIHLARNNHSVKIWEFFKEQADEMQNERVCKLLPEVNLPDNIFVSSNMKEVLSNSELVLLAVPSDKVEGTMDQAQQYLNGQAVVICSKGFASDSKLLSEVVKQKITGEVYCLYGPTHAEEVCKGVFSGIVLAGGAGKEKLKQVLEAPNLKVDLSDDLVGVQVAAALKNILAVFIGILDGLELGDNTKAYVMTKGLAEIREIGLKWGAKEETFHGLAGLGDLIVTCSSQHSRNRHVGVQIGKGKELDQVISEMGMVAEGVTTIKEAVKLQEKFGLSLPLINGLHGVLFEGHDPKEILTKI